MVCDTFETESAAFWKDDPNGPPPAEVKTEVFFLPVASGVEKEGTLTNTQRLLQWHNKALGPPGDCRSDSWIVACPRMAMTPPPGRPTLPSSSCRIAAVRIIWAPAVCCVHPTA